MSFNRANAKGQGKTAPRHSYAQALVGEAFILWMGRDSALRAGRITEIPSIWEIAEMAENRVAQKWPELVQGSPPRVVR